MVVSPDGYFESLFSPAALCASPPSLLKKSVCSPWFHFFLSSRCAGVFGSGSQSAPFALWLCRLLVRVSSVATALLTRVLAGSAETQDEKEQKRRRNPIAKKSKNLLPLDDMLELGHAFTHAMEGVGCVETEEAIVSDLLAAYDGGGAAVASPLSLVSACISALCR